jgi:uncharacterized membrane protein
MLTYTPFDPPTPSDSSPRRLRGNPLEGAFGPVNVGEVERYGSIVGGAALVVAGLSRRSLPGLLAAGLGGLFIVRGVAGHCRLYDSIGVSTSAPQRPGVPDQTGQKIEKTIFIARPPEELYRFWRNLENLPEFMESIESIRIMDDRHSHWVVKGPGGHRVEWDAEIVNEHPGEMISWQTLPGADVQSAGTVRFTSTEDGRGTLLRVVLEFHPPGGSLGARVARLFGRDPAARLERDLGRLKEIIESHDVSAAARAQEEALQDPSMD